MELEAVPGTESPAPADPFEETLEVGSATLEEASRTSTGSFAPVPTGARIGRFELRGELGRGGMGRVLEAWDPELRREVAVKLVLDGGNVSRSRLSRFVSEARITSQMEHPNIVPVHDMGVTPDGQIYFVMKKVSGRSLAQVLRSLREGDRGTCTHWTLNRRLRAFVQICQGVAYAHQMGVLHRDLKPANVMLGPFGEVLVMDWGLARLVPHDNEDSTPPPGFEVGESAQTVDGSAIGTPGYMPPEQAQGQLSLVDERSDVWSLGAILFELLALRRAFVTTEQTLGVASGERPRPDPRTEAPAMPIPDEIADVCLRAMASRRSRRYQAVSDLCSAVEFFLEGRRRREAARDRQTRADELWDEVETLRTERERLEAERAWLTGQALPHAPLDDPTKARRYEAQARIRELEGEVAAAFGRAVGAAEQALSHDPESVETRQFLAAAYWSRFEEAEAAGDRASAAYCRSRVEAYDLGHFGRLLTGIGALSLATEPAGAEVLAQPVERRGPAWTLGRIRQLGQTPLRNVPLGMGSWVLTLRHPDRQDAHYPVLIGRGELWTSGPAPVRLLAAHDLEPGFVYVPRGPFQREGEAVELAPFAISRFPVTWHEYLQFPGAVDSGAGRRAPGSWPASSMDWHDAVAYVAWRSERDRRRYRLPSEAEWEKAACGVDGRGFPWGDLFDASLCKNAAARPGRPSPEPVGAFAVDVSVYGVGDCAGGVRDWCGDPAFDGDPRLRPVRGGAWNANGKASRCSSRAAVDASRGRPDVGFRLVLEMF